MPARENGGTSSCETTSCASTRPFASQSMIVSTFAIGVPVLSRIARAASREMTSPNGRIRACGMLAGELPDEVPELGQQQLVHAEAHGVFRSGQRHDDLSLRRSGAGAAHHRRRPDLLIAQHAEQLAESLE